MKIIAIDYNGTLTRLDDPVGFIKQLRDNGCYVILRSAGNVPKEVRAVCNHAPWSKLTVFDIIRHIKEEELTPAGYFVCDDEVWGMPDEGIMQMCADMTGVPWHQVWATEIEKLLEV